MMNAGGKNVVKLQAYLLLFCACFTKNLHTFEMDFIVI